MTKDRKMKMKLPRSIKKIVICDKCNGSGLYQRPTSYTIEGKPVCFRCMGSGKILVKQPIVTRLYKVYDIGGEVYLVPAAKRKEFFPTLKAVAEKLETIGIYDENPLPF